MSEPDASLDRELVTAMYVLVKQVLALDSDNTKLRQACDRAADATNRLRARSGGAATIRFAAGGVTVNGNRVRLDREERERGEYLRALWGTFGVGGLAVAADTDAAGWLGVIGELERCIRAGGGSDALAGRAIGAIELAAADPDAEVDPGDGGDERDRALRAYAGATIATDALLAAIRDDRPARIVDLKHSLQALIGAANHNADLLMALVHCERNKRTVANHLVNTATLAIGMTRPLDLGRRARTRLAVQACLYGVGRAFDAPIDAADPDARAAALALESVCALLRALPTPGLHKGRVVAANEVRLWANHDTEAGDYPYPPSAAARVIAVAHAYDRLTTRTDERPALLPDEAIRVVMAEAGRRYDDTVVRLLVDLLGVYPVGSVVALSTGQLGIPVRASSSDSGWRRPLVKIVREPNGALVDGPTVDTARDVGGVRRIDRCVRPEDAGVNAPGFLIG